MITPMITRVCKYHKPLLLISITLFTCSSLISAKTVTDDQKLIYIDDQIRFADGLVSRGHYNLAIAEYLRLIEKFKDEPMVLACGNAPTFIYAAINTLIEQNINLDNVILLLFPVGFVNVVESKEYGKDFMNHYGVEGIILEGRYGASTMVVASLHAAYRLIKDYDSEFGKYNGK